MKRLADGLYQLAGFPPNTVNVYLMGGVLIDAATRFDAWHILRQLRGHDVEAHALTHAHPDHQGSSRRVCEARKIPLWCGAADADAAEDTSLMLSRLPRHGINRLFAPVAAGPAHPVARRLVEGDEVGGFRVLETPGHCAGHVSYWRESDRTLVMGDVLSHFPGLSGRPTLREPPSFFSVDPAENRRSARRLAALRPSLVCFGHGRPLRDPDRLARFAASLPP